MCWAAQACSGLSVPRFCSYAHALWAAWPPCSLSVPLQVHFFAFIHTQLHLPSCHLFNCLEQISRFPDSSLARTTLNNLSVIICSFLSPQLTFFFWVKTPPDGAFLPQRKWTDNCYFPFLLISHVIDLPRSCSCLIWLCLQQDFFQRALERKQYINFYSLLYWHTPRTLTDWSTSASTESHAACNLFSYSREGVSPCKPHSDVRPFK